MIVLAVNMANIVGTDALELLGHIMSMYSFVTGKVEFLVPASGLAACAGVITLTCWRTTKSSALKVTVLVPAVVE
jgi:hypothetical protein